ncbi:MAG: hypothetical protein HYZ53_07720 [Planctomycetes bacterium]|nr:hypothetical protein [Planctomycetota bacterium]
MPLDPNLRAFEIDERLVGDCLDAFLTDRLRRYERELVRRWIGQGLVRVNGEPGQPKYRLALGDRVEVHLPADADRQAPLLAPEDVLHRDDAFLILDAPPSPTAGSERPGSAASFLGGILSPFELSSAPERPRAEEWPSREGSGLLIAPRTAAIRPGLEAALCAPGAEVVWLALVEGEPEYEGGKIELSIGPHPKDAYRMRFDRGGEAAVTEFEVQERFRGYCLLALRPRSSSPHQLRVHCAGIRLPLAVDPLYGHRSALFLSEVKSGYKKKYGIEERPLLARLPLHASAVAFAHPTTGAPLAVRAPLAKDLDRVLKALRRHRPPRRRNPGSAPGGTPPATPA